MGRVEISPLKKAVTFRKVAMGTWDTPMDPSVYGFIEVDMAPALKFIEIYQQQHNVKISPLHLVAKATAMCIKERPEINSMIRGKRIYLRDKVRLFFQVNVPGEGPDATKKANLVGCSFDGIEDMSLKEISEQIKSRANKARSGEDKELNRGLALVKILPWWTIKWYLRFTSFVIYGLNWNLGFLGFPKDPFGSAMITNVGSLGIDFALAPLCAYTRTPLLITLGAIVEKPWVVDGQVVPHPILNVGVTFDHRMIDGIHAASMSKQFKQIFAEPEKYFS